MEQKPEAVASTDQLGLVPERDLPTMADVLDALTVFNKPAEGDEPWSATQFIAVTALPAFIHNVGRAWYGRFALEMAVAAERERMIADGWRQTRYVAPVTDCESCLTPDACAIRGQCGHYLRERA